MKIKLKKYLKNKIIADIFIIGSAIKDKIKPQDIDVIVLFKNKDYEIMQEIIYEIKKDIGIEQLHIEPLFVENMFKEKIFSSIIHEGISIRNNKNVGELIGYKPFSLFSFSLEKLEKIEKVRFAQALYGRKKNGLLKQENGKALGKGVFIIPINKEELFREIMLKFKTKFNVKRILLKDN